MISDDFKDEGSDRYISAALEKCRTLVRRYIDLDNCSLNSHITDATFILKQGSFERTTAKNYSLFTLFAIQFFVGRN